MKINLIFFLSRFTYGGAGLSIFKLCKALPKNKYNINIICLNECSFDKKFKKLKIKVFKLRYKKTFFAMPKIFFLIKKILKNRYKKNILISNIHYTNVLSIIFLRLISNLKIILVERTPLEELNIYFSKIDFLKKNFIKFLIRIFYRFSDEIVCNSKTIVKQYEKKFNIKSKTINPPSLVNFSKLKPKKIRNKKDIIITTICRLSNEKGIEIILNALKISKIKNYKFYIVGDGEEKDNLINLSKKLKISQNVKFFGLLKKINPILRNTDLFINSSYFEGFPNSVVEAINFNIPVICSQSYGGINEILLNGKCGTTFKNGDSKDLSNKINKFYLNPNKFNLMSKIAKINIKIFSLQNNLSNYDKLFNKI